MTINLSTLIDDVETRAPSPEPLDLLATASSTAVDVTDLTDAMLSHFVDRCRRAGHSWAEIGTALGVSKQAVQKRFTRSDLPAMWERVTPRARKVVEVHAPAAARELGHNWVGTEHLLLGLYGEPDGIAAKILVGFGLTREGVVAAVDARIEATGPAADDGALTPKAWIALTNSATEALRLGHNYVGTEHFLLSLLDDDGGLAHDVLGEAGITSAATTAKVVEFLAGYVLKQ